MYRFSPALRDALTANLTAFDRQAISRNDLKRAAVAVCVVPDTAGEACFVLTQRAAGLRAHARQWALPGGRVDAGEHVADAARREAAEEVGLGTTAGDVVGLLDDYATRSGYSITPVVVWRDHRSPLVANPDEVASVHLVPLADLDHPGTPRLVTIAESDAPVVQMRAAGEWIHAPTAAVLLQLREVALHGRATRVSHLEQPVWAWR